MSRLLQTLKGGDRRSIGRADSVVRKVLAGPERFAGIVAGLDDGDPLVRMRCADVAEKVSAVKPEWLAPYKKTLLDHAARATEQELRWHLAQMLPRLQLTAREQRRSIAVLLDYLNDRSRIVRTCALQALADFARGDRPLRRTVLPLVEKAARAGSPAERARARKLLAQLNGN